MKTVTDAPIDVSVTINGTNQTVGCQSLTQTDLPGFIALLEPQGADPLFWDTPALFDDVLLVNADRVDAVRSDSEYVSDLLGWGQ